MAAPNIVNVTSIYGKTSGLAVTTSATAIVANSAGSGKVLKVNALYVANVDGTDNADITVDFYDASASGGSGASFAVASTIIVPADATLDVISKSIYLEEGDELRLSANADSDLEAVCSYEEIN